MIIDISQEILSCQVYPGDPSPSANKLMDMDKGDLYNLTTFSMCAHNGTHVDAPAHFIRGGKTVDLMPPQAFVGKCYITCHNGLMTTEERSAIISRAQYAGASQRILISGDSVITADSARVFADADILLLGVESQSVGSVDEPMEVHEILLSQDIVLLEGLVLTNVPQGVYFLSALPINIAGAEGAPCRAYLIGENL